ncbi:hypothetical protein H8S37_04290 [Mediterraneibacter sp. NSJ-55]|uniref:Uncharacterized protein n=1 Tax=Mediterraneibacter hominis TaxID=2763054 RepID=A0A923LHC2_9FIRM|nr:hypothetical protein [Mediterraneibacter hominis]MBC5688152.1 hypothetical protein [Mediterraneibacter hominis]
MREMDFTTENIDCCEIGDIMEVTEYKLPASYWYLLENSYGASGNYKNAERLKSKFGKVVRKWKDKKFNYITLEFDE